MFALAVHSLVTALALWDWLRGGALVWKDRDVGVNTIRYEWSEDGWLRFEADQPFVSETGGTFYRSHRMIDRINQAVNKFLQEPEMKKNLDAQGMVPSGGAPDRFDKRIRGDYQRWLKVVGGGRCR